MRPVALPLHQIKPIARSVSVGTTLRYIRTRPLNVLEGADIAMAFVTSSPVVTPGPLYADYFLIRLISHSDTMSTKPSEFLMLSSFTNRTEMRNGRTVGRAAQRTELSAHAGDRHTQELFGWERAHA